jgi:putative NAD(P)-binding protein
VTFHLQTRCLNLLPLSLGTVLAELVKTHPELKITALVRNTSHIEAVRNLGVKVVQGNFSDTDLISSHVRAADISVNSADSDSTVLNEAILAGQKARVVDDGKPPAVLLHTSGVGVFLDGGTEGKHDPTSKLWNVRPHIAIMSCAFGEVYLCSAL